MEGFDRVLLQQNLLASIRKKVSRAIEEARPASFSHHHIEFSLMQEHVMWMTEENEIVEASLTFMPPVLNVVRLHEDLVRATGKAAAAIAHYECSTRRRRDGPLFSTDVERVPIRVLEDGDDASVATNALDGRAGKPGSILEATHP